MGGFDARYWWKGGSQRAVAREFGLARVTVQKMLRYAVPPGYQRPAGGEAAQTGAVGGRHRRHSGRR